MRRSEFIKIVLHHNPTWTVKHESSAYVRFFDGDEVVGGISSFCPYTNQTYLDPQGRHVAMFVAAYSKPVIKTLASIHGVGVHG